MKIVICGSSTFKEEMIKYRDILFSMGHEGLVHPNYEGYINGRNLEIYQQILHGEHAKVKRDNGYIKWYYDVIVESDAILILNFDNKGIKNYIGGNTLMEMGFAYVNNKRVFLFNPIPEKVPYVEEIKAMYDVTLNGDFNNINRYLTGAKICDHTSVGMLVWQEKKLLLIERNKPPYGFAPPAGHCDGEEFNVAVKKELQEEVGLVTTSFKLLIEGIKKNPCRRIDGTWHYWKIFEVKAEGELSRSLLETKQIKWVDTDELRKFAQRTEEYQTWKISEDDWRKDSGLEPVWYEWFKELNLIN